MSRKSVSRQLEAVQQLLICTQAGIDLYFDPYQVAYDKVFHIDFKCCLLYDYIAFSL